VRERVFSGEQGVSVDADRDGRDGEATHVVALEGDRVVGTCRLVFQGGLARLGRMAVEPDLRGRGIGARILGEAERAARSAGAERIALHAQLRAAALYERSGYQPRGRQFVEQGIEHVAMEKGLGEEPGGLRPPTSGSAGSPPGHSASTGADHA
jgi:predicted GNAT family N-acyltransferase